MKRFVIFLLVICTLPICAQPTYDGNKLSVYLKELIRVPSSSKWNRPRIESDKVCVLMKLTNGSCIRDVANEYGCEILDSIGQIYILDIPFRAIGGMSMDSRVNRIEAHEAPQPLMNQVPTTVGADKVWSGEGLPQAFTGKGVIAGVIDSDMDFTHPMLLDANGNKRIRRYIDMTLDSEGNTKNDIYGTEELKNMKSSIKALQSYHGTHVASIMTGSPVIGNMGRYSGIAPESDIVFVGQPKSRAFTFGKKGDTTASFILAFKHIFDYADEVDQPCVINASWGVNYSLIDPCILENEALKEMTGPGRIIVAGAGNDGNKLTVLDKPEGVQEVEARFATNKSPFVTFLLTSQPQDVVFRVLPDLEIAFNTDTLETLGAGEVCELHADSLIYIDAFKVGGLPSYINTNVYEMFFYIDDYLALENVNSSWWPSLNKLSLRSEYPCMMYAYPNLCYFRDDQQDSLNSQYTVFWPAESDDVIAVGSINDRKSAYGDIGVLSTFSSQGPTWDGHIKPDVVAPGANINAAGSHFSRYVFTCTAVDTIKWNDDNVYKIISNTGTSMASPVVAGAVALWLQANPNLSPKDIRELLAKTCKRPDTEMTYPNNMYGYGAIDVYAGLLDILGADNIKAISRHQPQGVQIQLAGRQLTVIDPDTHNPLMDCESLQVYNLSGHLVATSKCHTINLTHLPPGVYAVQLNAKDSRNTGSTLIRLL